MRGLTEKLEHIPMPKAAPALENLWLLLGYIQPEAVSSDFECPREFLGLVWVAELSFQEPGEERTLRNSRAAKTFQEGAPSVLWESSETQLGPRGGGSRWE